MNLLKEELKRSWMNLQRRKYQRIFAFKSDQWVQLNIAQFRLEQNKWKIYWQDSKSKWHFIDDYAPDEDFDKQLTIVDENKRGMFWG